MHKDDILSLHTNIAMWNYLPIQTEECLAKTSSSELRRKRKLEGKNIAFFKMP